MNTLCTQEKTSREMWVWAISLPDIPEMHCHCKLIYICLLGLSDRCPMTMEQSCMQLHQVSTFLLIFLLLFVLCRAVGLCRGLCLAALPCKGIDDNSTSKFRFSRLPMPPF